MEARQPVRRRARQPRHVGGRDVGHVGHVGPDRRACRARSSGMSGPIVGHVGHVGPDFGRSSGRRLSEIALLGFHTILLMVLMPWQGIISMLMPGACLHDDAF